MTQLRVNDIRMSACRVARVGFVSTRRTDRFSRQLPQYVDGGMFGRSSLESTRRSDRGLLGGGDESRMMVGGRTPGADSCRSSFFSHRGYQTSSASVFSARTSFTSAVSSAGHTTHSSSSSSSSAATMATADAVPMATAAAAAPPANDVSSTSLARYIYEHCRPSDTSVTLAVYPHERRRSR